MANSPRPGVWALEKSTDGGENWEAWQYFAGNDVECQKYFGMHANQKIERDDQVVCSTQFSKVLPLENGEIYVSLTSGRPSATDLWSSQTLLDWLEATNIRLRFIQTKTMLGHLMSVAQGDKTVTRRVSQWSNNWYILLENFHCSTTTVSKKLPWEADVYVTVMQHFARRLRIHPIYWNVYANTEPQAPTASNVLKASFRNLGGRTPKPILSSVKNVIAMDIQTNVITMKRWLPRVYRWTSMEITKAEASVKNANITLKATIARLVNLAFSDQSMFCPTPLNLAYVIGASILEEILYFLTLVCFYSLRLRGWRSVQWKLRCRWWSMRM